MGNTNGKQAARNTADSEPPTTQDHKFSTTGATLYSGLFIRPNTHHSPKNIYPQFLGYTVLERLAASDIVLGRSFDGSPGHQNTY